MKLNGNLVGNVDGSSEIRNISIEKITAVQQGALGLGAAHKGRIIFNTDENKYKYWDGVAFQDFATGGAAASQTDFDNLVASMGYVDASGNFTEAALNALSNISGLTAGSTLVDALSQLSAAIDAAAGVDTLPELSDVTVTTAAANDFIVANGDGSTYVNMNGAAARTAMGVVIGTDVQAHDADLDALAGITHADGDFIVSNGTAWVAESGATARTSLDVYSTTEVDTAIGNLSADSLTDVAITTATTGDVLYYNGTNFVNESTGAVSGVQGYDAGLQSIAGLTTAADLMIYTDGSDSYATTALTAFARTLMDDADAATARGTLGLVSGGAGDIWVEKAGDTMSGNLAMGGNVVSGLANPTNDTDAANKGYVDSALAGLTWKNSVRVASTANIDLATGGLIAVDGITVADGDRVLVMNQTNAAQNGIYIAAAGAWVRATDFDNLTPVDEINGAAVYVEEGSTYGDAGYTVSSQVAILETDNIDFTQFNGAAAITAGIGLGKTGNTLFVNLGAGIGQLPSDEVGIDLYDAANGALILTTDGSTRGTDGADALALLLDGSSLTQTSAGLKVDAQGITATELNASVAGAGLVGGNGTALALNHSGEFEIVTDALNLKDGQIANAKLTNAGFSVTADSGITHTPDLGEVVDFTGGVGIDIATVGPGGSGASIQVDLNAAAQLLTDVPVAVADTVLVRNAGNTAYEAQSASTLLGAASAGDLSDVDTTGAVDGSLLVNNGTQFVAQKAYHLYTSGAASTSHSVAHSIGQKFCNVTVVDATDEVIIPQSITFTDANNLVVTFNTAIDCKVVVMGIA